MLGAILGGIGAVGGLLGGIGKSRNDSKDRNESARQFDQTLGFERMRDSRTDERTRLMGTDRRALAQQLLARLGIRSALGSAHAPTAQPGAPGFGAAPQAGSAERALELARALGVDLTRRRSGGA